MTLSRPVFRAATRLFFAVAAMLLMVGEGYSAGASSNEFTEDKLNIALGPKNPVFVIKLKSNPTTGYAWFLREYDAGLITPVKHVFQSSGDKLIGAPGYELWTFRVKPAAFVVPQQTTIRFIYARPWQTADDAKQVVFRVSTALP